MSPFFENIAALALSYFFPEKYSFRYHTDFCTGKLIRKLIILEGYRVNTGICDTVAKKWLNRPDQGDRDQHNFYMNQEAKGQLGAVDDECVWKPLLKKYGRERLPEFK